MNFPTFARVSFLYPWFLLASLAVAVPIIIHLFNFRRYKKVFFPDVRFLKELQEQTQKHSQLKHLLILLCRILAILAIVFAFAQPFFNGDKDKMVQGSKHVSLYLDNSFSMGVERNALSMLDMAKGKAKEIIETYHNNDQFQILTNDFAYNENRFLSKEEALRQLSTIQLTPLSRKAEVILEKQKQLLQTTSSNNKQIIFISDFQKNNFNNQLNSEDDIRKYFVSLKASGINNVTLDSAWFETPSLLLNEPNVMNVRLKNNGEEEVNTSITVMVNGQPKSATQVALKPLETRNELVNFSTSVAGTQRIKLFLQDSPVQFDDTFFVSGKVHSNYSVLILNQQNANPYLSSVFKPNAQFRMDNYNIQSLNTDVLKNYTLVVLNNVTAIPEKISKALEDFAQSGGAILIFAPQQNNTTGINDFLNKTIGAQFMQYDTAKTQVTDYNKNHNLFKDLFVKTPDNVELPVAFKHFVISKTAMTSEQKLFNFSNGDAFLSDFIHGNGHLYICASAAELTATNFPRSYWFLPLLYKMAYSNAASKIYAVTLGKNAKVEIPNATTQTTGDKIIYHMGGNGLDAIPEQRSMNNMMQLYLNKGISQAGLYDVYAEGGKDTTCVGVNFDRSESKMDFWKLNELKEIKGLKNAQWLDGEWNVAGEINELHHGMPLWKLCIILALSFLLLETLLIRFMK